MGTTAGGGAPDPIGRSSAEAATYRGAPAAPNTGSKGLAWLGLKHSLRSRLEHNSCCRTTHQSGGRPQRPPGRSRQEQGGKGAEPTERDALLLVLLPRVGWSVPGMGWMLRTGLRRPKVDWQQCFS